MLAVGLRCGVARLVHGEEDAAVHGLEAIAHVGQRSASDDTHGIVEEGLLHEIANGFVEDFPRCKGSEEWKLRR
jgi:hypothetical protein